LAYICDDTRDKPTHSVDTIFDTNSVEEKGKGGTDAEVDADTKANVRATDTVSLIPTDYKQRTNDAANNMIRLQATDCPNWDVLYEKDGVKASKLNSGGICVKGEGILPFAIYDIFRLVCTTTRMTELDTQMDRNHKIETLALGSSHEYFRWKAVWPTAARDMTNYSHW